MPVPSFRGTTVVPSVYAESNLGWCHQLVVAAHRTCHTCIEKTAISLSGSHMSPGCEVQNNNNNIITIKDHTPSCQIEYLIGARMGVVVDKSFFHIVGHGVIP